ncbi:MAG: helix-turn-helix domain-containing protein, partial [Planctomycetota bacterium]
ARERLDLARRGEVDQVLDAAGNAHHFLARACREFGREVHGLTPAAVTALELHAWPGNVRELENTLQRAALMSSGPWIDVDDLSLGNVRGPASADDVVAIGDRSLRCVEENLIRRVLQESSGNRSRAASVLGINRTTLYAKLKTYGIAG